jgi:hypothetical protein
VTSLRSRTGLPPGAPANAPVDKAISAAMWRPVAHSRSGEHHTARSMATSILKISTRSTSAKTTRWPWRPSAANHLGHGVTPSDHRRTPSIPGSRDQARRQLGALLVAVTGFDATGDAQPEILQGGPSRSVGVGPRQPATCQPGHLVCHRILDRAVGASACSRTGCASPGQGRPCHRIEPSSSATNPNGGHRRGLPGTAVFKQMRPAGRPALPSRASPLRSVTGR